MSSNNGGRLRPSRIQCHHLGGRLLACVRPTIPCADERPATVQQRTGWTARLSSTLPLPWTVHIPLLLTATTTAVPWDIYIYIFYVIYLVVRCNPSRPYSPYGRPHRPITVLGHLPVRIIAAPQIEFGRRPVFDDDCNEFIRIRRVWFLADEYVKEAIIIFIVRSTARGALVKCTFFWTR